MVIDSRFLSDAGAVLALAKPNQHVGIMEYVLVDPTADGTVLVTAKTPSISASFICRVVVPPIKPVCFLAQPLLSILKTMPAEAKIEIVASKTKKGMATVTGDGLTADLPIVAPGEFPKILSQGGENGSQIDPKQLLEVIRMGSIICDSESQNFFFQSPVCGPSGVVAAAHHGVVLDRSIKMDNPTQINISGKDSLSSLAKSGKQITVSPATGQVIFSSKDAGFVAQSCGFDIGGAQKIYDSVFGVIDGASKETVISSFQTTVDVMIACVRRVMLSNTYVMKMESDGTSIKMSASGDGMTGGEMQKIDSMQEIAIEAEKFETNFGPKQLMQMLSVIDGEIEVKMVVNPKNPDFPPAMYIISSSKEVILQSLQV